LPTWPTAFFDFGSLCLQLIEVTHRKSLGDMNQISADEVDCRIKEFQEWAVYQPDLPQKIGKIASLNNYRVDLHLIESNYLHRETFTFALPENESMARGKGAAIVAV